MAADGAPAPPDHDGEARYAQAEQATEVTQAEQATEVTQAEQGSRVEGALHDVRVVEVGLDSLAQKSRFTQYRTIAALGMLVGVAGLAIGGGIVADNEVFWTGAVSVFFLACAGLVAWAAKTLGVFAEMAELFRTNLGAARETLAQETKSESREHSSGSPIASDPPGTVRW